MTIDSLLRRLQQEPPPPPDELAFPRKQLAVAALLVEAAQIDGGVLAKERSVVARLVREQFRLPEAEAERLVQIAEGEFVAALDDWVFTEAVRQGFSAEERGEILEMLWEVVYADGGLARFEDELMHRIESALQIEPELAERAREVAFARVGLPAAEGGGAE